jgi:hypothetical protein
MYISVNPTASKGAGPSLGAGGEVRPIRAGA